MSDAPSLQPKKRAQRATKPLTNATTTTTTTMHQNSHQNSTTNQLRGPGSYNPHKAYTTAPSFSMGSRFKNKDSEMWQRGPGSYDFGEPKRGPSFSLGVRDSVKSNHGFSIPGPGAYNSDRSSFTKNSAPSYSIGGRSTIKDTSSQSPGPGAYNIEYSSTAKTTAGGSNYHHVNSNSRAAVLDATPTSTFGRSSMKSAPAFSFGGRAQSHLDSTPGPGAYNLDKGGSSKRGPSYSIASRENRFKKETKGGFSPGPGAYNVSSVGGRSAPSYTIAQKRHETSIS